MSIGGINFCDLCGEPVLPDDVAPLRMKEDGHLREHHFHNRHPEDFLAQQLTILDKELAPAA